MEISHLPLYIWNFAQIIAYTSLLTLSIYWYKKKSKKGTLFMLIGFLIAIVSQALIILLDVDYLYINLQMQGASMAEIQLLASVYNTFEFALFCAFLACLGIGLYFLNRE